jgi:hypothetical protein
MRAYGRWTGRQIASQVIERAHDPERAGALLHSQRHRARAELAGASGAEPSLSARRQKDRGWGRATPALPLTIDELGTSTRPRRTIDRARRVTLLRGPPKQFSTATET